MLFFSISALVFLLHNYDKPGFLTKYIDTWEKPNIYEVINQPSLLTRDMRIHQIWITYCQLCFCLYKRGKRQSDKFALRNMQMWTTKCIKSEIFSRLCTLCISNHCQTGTYARASLGCKAPEIPHILKTSLSKMVALTKQKEYGWERLNVSFSNSEVIFFIFVQPWF